MLNSSTLLKLNVQLRQNIWEHTIEDEDDFESHLDYIHFNPVKHGYVSRPADWPHSSFHRWVEKGIYELNWGSDREQPLAIPKLNRNVGE